MISHSSEWFHLKGENHPWSAAHSLMHAGAVTAPLCKGLQLPAAGSWPGHRTGKGQRLGNRGGAPTVPATLNLGQLFLFISSVLFRCFVIITSFLYTTDTALSHRLAP